MQSDASPVQSHSPAPLGRVPPTPALPPAARRPQAMAACTTIFSSPWTGCPRYVSERWTLGPLAASNCRAPDRAAQSAPASPTLACAHTGRRGQPWRARCWGAWRRSPRNAPSTPSCCAWARHWQRASALRTHALPLAGSRLARTPMCAPGLSSLRPGAGHASSGGGNSRLGHQSSPRQANSSLLQRLLQWAGGACLLLCDRPRATYHSRFWQ